MSDRNDALQLAITSVLEDVNTCLPGTVVSYDGHYAVVKPSLSKLIADGRVLSAPVIVDVPVVWPGGQQWRISGPLQKGDGVILHFSQRALEGWLDTGSPIPADPRRFHISDAVAVPGLNPANYFTGTSDTTNLCLVFGGGTFQMTPQGALNLIFPGGVNISQGTLTVAQEINVAGITLSNHEHIGVQTGSGNTGAPLAGT